MSATPAVRGVVLDLDGTLTRPGAIDFAGMRRRLGMPGPGSVLHWIAEVASSPAEAAEMHRVVEEVEAEGLARMELAEGFDGLVEALRAAEGAPRAAICTRNNRAALEAFGALLARRGYPALDELFPVRVARDHHSVRLGRPLAPKPSPEPAHECVAGWGLDGRFPAVHQAETDPVRYPELLFVGDGVDDLRCGRRAGFRAVWLAHGGGGQGAPAVPAEHIGRLDGVAALLR